MSWLVQFSFRSKQFAIGLVTQKTSIVRGQVAFTVDPIASKDLIFTLELCLTQVSAERCKFGVGSYTTFATLVEQSNKMLGPTAFMSDSHLLP